MLCLIHNNTIGAGSGFNKLLKVRHESSHILLKLQGLKKNSYLSKNIFIFLLLKKSFKKNQNIFIATDHRLKKYFYKSKFFIFW